MPALALTVLGLARLAAACTLAALGVGAALGAGWVLRWLLAREQGE